MLNLLRRKGRILLLDDDAAMRRLVSLILGRAGYRVDVVGSGNEAIRKLAHEEYDGVVLDLMMPHEGGMTVIKHLREHRPETLRRVVLMTGAPDALLRQFDGEIFGFVRKPFDIDDLTGTIGRLTGNG